MQSNGMYEHILSYKKKKKILIQSEWGQTMIFHGLESTEIYKVNNEGTQQNSKLLCTVADLCGIHVFFFLLKRK